MKNLEILMLEEKEIKILKEMEKVYRETGLNVSLWNGKFQLHEEQPQFPLQDAEFYYYDGEDFITP